jgi:type VI secretion system protein VasD
MRLISAVLALVFVLAACAGSDPKTPKEPVKLELSIEAAGDVNLDSQKRAAPIVVRIYELKSDENFNAADFFSLQEKDKTVLADDLLARDQFQLRPGESKAIKRKADPATVTIGVLAAYRDLPNAVWRKTFSMPGSPDAAWYRFSPKLKLVVKLDANAIRIVEAK